MRTNSDQIFTGSAQVRSSDMDEAADVLSRVYLPVTLSPTGADRLDMSLKAEELSRLTAGYLHFGVDLSIGGDEVADYFVEAPLSGRAVNQWRDGRVVKTEAGCAAVFTPGTPVDLNWSRGCRQLVIKITEQQLRYQLETMLGQPVRQRITFARQLNLRTGKGRHWFDLVGLLSREAGRSQGVLSHRLAVENLQHLLIEGLLLIQPHNYAEALTESEPAASAAVVKRAIDVLHAHPETPWTTAQLALATGVSARALQKAFQRSGRPAPMAYLRWLRLNCVRAELASGACDSVTVTTVAGRWGFLHLGRFAGQYRRLFGESPSETLGGAVSRNPAAPRQAKQTPRTDR